MNYFLLAKSTPYVKLQLGLADDASEKRARMNTYAHVDIQSTFSPVK